MSKPLTNRLPTDLKALSDAALDKLFQQVVGTTLDLLSASAESCLYLGKIYQEMLRRGRVVREYHQQMGVFLVAMAEGKLSPHAFVKCLGNITLLKRVSLLSVQRQEKAAEEGLPVFVPSKLGTRPAAPVAVQKPLRDISCEEIRQVISPIGKVRTPTEQAAYLAEKAAEAPPVIEKEHVVEFVLKDAQYNKLLEASRIRGMSIQRLVIYALKKEEVI